MDWHVVKFQNITMSHTYNRAEYCTWSDMSYSFRTSLYLIGTMKQNIVHGVTCDTVSEHLFVSHVFELNIVYGVWFDIQVVSELYYISHVHLNRMFYMEWHLMQFQNVTLSHTYFETEYFTWINIWYVLRTSVYWNINSIHGMICGKISELLCYSHYIETQYCAWSDMWYSFRRTVYLTLYWKGILYMEWHVIHCQNIGISHTNIETVYLNGLTSDTVSKFLYHSYIYGNRVLHTEWYVTV